MDSRALCTCYGILIALDIAKGSPQLKDIVLITKVLGKIYAA